MDDIPVELRLVVFGLLSSKLAAFAARYCPQLAGDELKLAVERTMLGESPAVRRGEAANVAKEASAHFAGNGHRETGKARRLKEAMKQTGIGAQADSRDSAGFSSSLAGINRLPGSPAGTAAIRARGEPADSVPQVVYQNFQTVGTQSFNTWAENATASLQDASSPMDSAIYSPQQLIRQGSACQTLLRPGCMPMAAQLPGRTGTGAGGASTTTITTSMHRAHSGSLKETLQQLGMHATAGPPPQPKQRGAKVCKLANLLNMAAPPGPADLQGQLMRAETAQPSASGRAASGQLSDMQVQVTRAASGPLSDFQAPIARAASASLHDLHLHLVRVSSGSLTDLQAHLSRSPGPLSDLQMQMARVSSADLHEQHVRTSSAQLIELDRTLSGKPTDLQVQLRHCLGTGTGQVLGSSMVRLPSSSFAMDTMARLSSASLPMESSMARLPSSSLAMEAIARLSSASLALDAGISTLLAADLALRDVPSSPFAGLHPAAAKGKWTACDTPQSGSETKSYTAVGGGATPRPRGWHEGDAESSGSKRSRSIEHNEGSPVKEAGTQGMEGNGGVKRPTPSRLTTNSSVGEGAAAGIQQYSAFQPYAGVACFAAGLPSLAEAAALLGGTSSGINPSMSPGQGSTLEMYEVYKSGSALLSLSMDAPRADTSQFTMLAPALGSFGNWTTALALQVPIPGSEIRSGLSDRLPDPELYRDFVPPLFQQEQRR